MELNRIAVFGADGRLGQVITRALLECREKTFDVLAIKPPQTLEPDVPESEHYECRTVNLLNITQDKLKDQLKGIDAVVCALNGKALEVQPLIQDAAADVGVKRFYPSEYGCHAVYRKPGDEWGYVHPIWDTKNKLLESAVHHDAIQDGDMSYTVIGCGDFYDKENEPMWCPWTQEFPERNVYTLHVVGSPQTKAQYTHTDDFARFLVATLCEPEKSENATLNFVSDEVSHGQIAQMLEKFTGRETKIEMHSESDVHNIVKDPSRAPEKLRENSALPVDFCFIVKAAQSQSRFRRPKGEIHNHLFPNVKPTTLEQYLRRLHLGTDDVEERPSGPTRRETA
ncbi:NAD(P)-binding protein [Hortaea werneckii]|nr:NAD(P)-binding protein [Hortaea werneckii]KAI6802083.1 NAD(P)-binding protein [Hortaea werneckii]KAI6903022.1 NAD(P)-binding protein [Hortaea werneckii]KAI6924890.1 NAD(P)-binding protein [Hortaea werneckii]KAI6955783.1 NAD(P)-binding protein [Hortaea werneckii]